jgi:lipoic acid synthetase
MASIVHSRHLHTVCEEALCPNVGRCWESGHATLMILGDRCSRQCAFCNVNSHKPLPPDETEPARVADAVAAMGLRDIVLTSVTRDDLPDGGAGAWAATIAAIRARCPGLLIEVLVPDFGGQPAALTAVLNARPDIFGHNVETVPSLYRTVRPQADYARSLAVLRTATQASLITKTAVMLGMGEESGEVVATLRDIRETGCAILYLGQYLQPSRQHHPVTRYVTPEEFNALGKTATALGFDVVVSEPLARSSFHSDAQATFVRRRLASR